MATYLVVSKIKTLASKKGRRVGKDYIDYLDRFVEEKIDRACETHNGGKITLDKSIASLTLGKAGA